MAETPNRTPSFVALALVAAALIVAAVQGFGSGSLLGTILAAVAVVPAAVGMWKGVQEKTQTGLGIALLAMLSAIGVAALLMVLTVVGWLR